jgi:hypothetical protein
MEKSEDCQGKNAGRLQNQNQIGFRAKVLLCDDGSIPSAV